MCRAARATGVTAVTDVRYRGRRPTHPVTASPEGYVLALHARFGADTVAIDEVQLASSGSTNEPSGASALQQRHPDRFVAGVVLHCGSETLPFGPGLHAMPISALWTT